MADEDVYAAFETEAPDAWGGGNPFAGAPPMSGGGNPLLQAPPSQWGAGNGMGSAWGATGSRLGTMGGALSGAARPMTSNRPVGFNSTGNANMFDPTGQSRMAGMALGPAPPLKKRSENSPEEQCAEMERQVNKLIEESAMLAKQKDYGAALEKAKEAGKKDRLLCKQREELGLGEQVNIDLTYAVHFNLAVQYQNHELYSEALNTYNLIIRNADFPQAGRLRVNMGNIYAAQKKYSLAIKMYRTALDEAPSSGKELRNKLFRNIGNCFVKLGQYRDAVNNFETIVENGGDVSVAMNLLLCYYALGETEKVKRAFNKMINCRPEGLDDEEDFEEEEEKKDVLVDDALRNELKERRAHFLHCIITAARLIAPIIAKDWREGYDYVIQQLRQYEMRDPTSHVASELEMCKYLNYLKHKQYKEAITGLKEFEKKDPALRARAATNLAYLYFLEGEYDQGEKYSNLSIEANQYNAKALVNKGNFLFKKGSLEEAKEFYHKALAVEADNIEAIYNLGLSAKHLGLYEEAVKMFKRVQVLVDSSEVLYQVADINDLLGDPSTLEWFSRLIGRVPTDPNALARMGSLYAREGDETQAFHYYLEAYRYYQVNMDVISWLGAYFVKNEVYDKAIQFFERASQIQPQEVRWPLMIASCHRRRGDVVQAKRLYEQVHRKNPDNVECIKYLVQLCKDSGLVEEANEWFKEMKKAERKQLNEGGSGEDEEKEATAETEGESTAGRRRGGTGLTSDMTAGFSDDDVDKKLRKKKDSDSDEDLDIPGLE
ncbi:intraflagellar transport protein IFT88 [Angomonas deanei]|uniref:Tetratricopeptide repeat/Tetratricopeptide repeat-like domain containing protein, putative n=1 Tax=Angomonas deanei TaxID=59799 RepID=S9WJD5_9TRYP|nr:intraflagellar transport protein IFT88 [Angomonas deanei]EPY42475.1 intraflagellar transport protein IFT88 [Angomonas deanei]CAD2215502.1 Tetratricopeptide repeat/Tetratricopeptide repeat-like domain containing protein, putative [Angomonas deanei]|eukprot:EPY36045.1 intraflagellar transport protein IFT88 [Angomonas deanei]